MKKKTSSRVLIISAIAIAYAMIVYMLFNVADFVTGVPLFIAIAAMIFFLAMLSFVGGTLWEKENHALKQDDFRDGVTSQANQ